MWTSVQCKDLFYYGVQIDLQNIVYIDKIRVHIAP